MSKPYDVVVFIGRFQPPTNAHIEIISQAIQYGERVVVLAGSANQSRTVKNPWMVDERREMIVKNFSEEDQDKIVVFPLTDRMYNDQLWVRDVQAIVDVTAGPDDKVAIIGHDKDDSTYYLKMFPQWEALEMENIDDLNATDVRNIYFNPLYTLHKEGSTFDLNVKDKLPKGTAVFLTRFKHTDDYATLVEEFEYIQRYKDAWKAAPYPVIFTTTDSVVVQSGHVLMVRRKTAPGKGLWALPGGFLGHDERIIDSMIRELREETKLKVPVPVLKGSIKAKEVYDNPNRSLRGRTVTHAFAIMLPGGPLSKVKGGSDAARAEWVPLTQIERMKDQIFEDHYHIITDMVERM